MEQTFKILQKSREKLEKMCVDLPHETLNRIPEGFNNNLIWNLGHIVAVQQLIIYGLSKLPYVVDDFIIDNFRNKTRPERAFTTEEIGLVFSALTSSILQLEKDYKDNKFVNPTPFISKTLEASFEGIDGLIQFNLYHEGIHTGVIQKYLQLLS